MVRVHDWELIKRCLPVERKLRIVQSVSLRVKLQWKSQFYVFPLNNDWSKNLIASNGPPGFFPDRIFRISLIYDTNKNVFFNNSISDWFALSSASSQQRWQMISTKQHPCCDNSFSIFFRNYSEALKLPKSSRRKGQRWQWLVAVARE